jgi:hypothetical protein
MYGSSYPKFWVNSSRNAHIIGPSKNFCKGTPSIVQDAPPLRSGEKEERITENDRKDLLHWQQDIPLVGSRNLEDRKETLFKFSMLRECDGAEKMFQSNYLGLKLEALVLFGSLAQCSGLMKRNYLVWHTKSLRDSSVKSNSTGTVNIPSNHRESGKCGLKIVLNNQSDPRRWQRTGIDIDAGQSHTVYEMLRIRTVIFDGQIEQRD